MAKRIIWSKRAQSDRKEILKYFIRRNKSKEYSIKLNELFKDAINLIATYPTIGKQTDDKNTRIKIVRDYLMVYEIKEEQIIILTIWDSRQNTEKLKKIHKK